MAYYTSILLIIRHIERIMKEITIKIRLWQIAM